MPARDDITAQELADRIPDIVIITGMAGSGRTQAMHVFEDMGYFCIDNLPPRLILQLAELVGINAGIGRHLAVTCDLRSQGLFDELLDLDGASDARIFFQVVLPMSKPILVYTIISSFMIPWTDFVMAKMILNSGVSTDWTVAIGLFNMLQRTLINNYFALFCAGGVLVSVPISILFIIMQKFYVAGITAGADKG